MQLCERHPDAVADSRQAARRVTFTLSYAALGEEIGLAETILVEVMGRHAIRVDDPAEHDQRRHADEGRLEEAVPCLADGDVLRHVRKDACRDGDEHQQDAGGDGRTEQKPAHRGRHRPPAGGSVREVRARAMSSENAPENPTVPQASRKA